MRRNITTKMVNDRIFNIRGVKVVIDRDLAEFYDISTKVLNQTIKRNLKRFPLEFRFQLTMDEKNELVTNCDRLKSITLALRSKT